MTIYSMINDGYKYQEFALEIDDILDFVPDDLNYNALEVDDFSLHNLSLKSWWPDIQTGFTPIGKKKGMKIPDVCRWIGATIILSPVAYKLLHDTLDEYGELLPVNCGDDTFHIFNCLTSGKVDEDKSEREYYKSQITNIKKLVFDQDDVADKPIFKTEYTHCMDIFCHDQIKDIIEKNELTGISFGERLAGQF